MRAIRLARVGVKRVDVSGLGRLSCVGRCSKIGINLFLVLRKFWQENSGGVVVALVCKAFWYLENSGGKILAGS